MADETYDPFNLRKHPGYYAELVQERDPTQDVAASYVKNHQYDGGILGQLERNPHGLGDSPLPFDPSGAEVRSTSEGGSAFAARPKDHMQPVAELISPTLGAFGAGQMAGTAYKEAGEGDYQEAGMSLAPLLAGMVVPGAPKGARGPKAISREIDARGFYSPSLEAVKGLGQETGTVQQFRSMLLKAGGKPKELEAVGFDRAFPDPNAKLSRQEIEQYLRDNRVQLGVTELRGHPMGRSMEEIEANPTAARHEHWSTTGGEPGSYKEAVTTLDQGPDLNYVDESHYPGIPNYLLHSRSKKFNNPDGTSTLVSDEFQSTRAQRARDQGTRDPAQIAQWEQRKAELEQRQRDIEDEMAAYIEERTGQKAPADEYGVDVLDKLIASGTADNRANELMGRWYGLTEPLADINTKLNAVRDGVPSAPYISNTSDWVDLGLKQALIDAAKDPSVNRLAWAPGKVQADRYGLEKHVDSLAYNESQQMLYAYDKDGNAVLAESNVPPEKIAEYVGREASEKLLGQPYEQIKMRGAEGQKMKRLKGQELVMGGEGMKSFYGDLTPEGYQSGIIGTRLQKLVKGLDPDAARVEPTDIIQSKGGPSGGPQSRMLADIKQSYPSIPITPAMREKILKEGLPLFNVAALSALVSRILGQGQPDTEDEGRGGGF
jgi:hypothetical protein